MKKSILILCSALILTAFAACGAQPAASSSQASSEVVVSSEAASSEATSSDDAAAAAMSEERLVVADAAMFTGILEDFAMSDDGKTVWILKNNDAELSSINVAVDENTRYSFDSTELGNGAQLEVFYSGDPTKGDVTAIAVNRVETDLVPSGEPAADGEMIYDGEVVEVRMDETKEGVGSIEMKSFAGDNAYVFNFGPETKMNVDVTTLKAGDKLHVVHSMMATRSIPPQSPAIEISTYTAA